LTYAQKFFLQNLHFQAVSAVDRGPLKNHKLLFLIEYLNLLSSRAIQAKPYFSRLWGASDRVFNKVIHSLLGLSLKILKNNNLPDVSRIFISKKMTECRIALVLREAHRVLNAKVA
jgi:hypothetical protein